MNPYRLLLLTGLVFGFPLLQAADAPAAASSATSPAATAPATEEKTALETPRAVAVDKDGNLYIADFGASTIYKFTTAGKLIRIAGQPASSGSTDGPALKATFLDPSGIAVDQKGNVYVADSDNNLIRKISTDGIVTTLGAGSANTTAAAQAGKAATFTFNGPTSLVVDKDGNVFVADDHNAAIRKIAPDGTVTTFAGKVGESGYKDGAGAEARFDGPRGIAIDPAGNLYVADENLSNIRKITPAGNVTTLAGRLGASGDKDGPGTEATFAAPHGLAVDKDGNVYVADTDNALVRKITPAGVVTTLAGKTGAVGSTDGKAADARFAGLRGIAVDAAGNLYVADSDNGTIRKITPVGEVSTLVGTPSSQ